MGNIIAETAGGGATGTSGTVREYIWLPEAEIAPTMGSRAQVDRSLAVVEAVNTAAPIVYYVHVDHLHRPVKMTSEAKATVWEAVWQPFGGLHAVTGAASINLRFPGQWFQAETGLHYNWHRSYDPSLGRYTQVDPLGFVDGPSVYGYAGGSPFRWVDKDGLRRGILGRPRPISFPPIPLPPISLPEIPNPTLRLIYTVCSTLLSQILDWEKDRCENIRKSEQDECNEALRETGDWGEYKSCSKQAWANYYNCMRQEVPPTHQPPRG
jgi:RHS repeat-associated protein